jgi:Cu-processing system permease protein
MRRAWWPLPTTFSGKTIRDRILYLVMVFAVAMLGATVLIPQVANQAHNKIIADLGLAAIHFFGLIVAIFVGHRAGE